MKLRYQLLICALLGAVMAFVAGYAALDMNPQGEFSSLDRGEWTADFYWLVIAWWSVVSIPLMVLCSLFSLLARHLRR